MKKIYIDVSMVMVGTNYTGVPRVVMEVAKRLYKKNDIELVFLEYSQKKDAFELLNTDKFIEFCNTKTDNRKPIRTGRFLDFEQLKGPDAVFFDVDAVWKTRVRRSFLYPILKKNHVRIVPFVHDIIGVTDPQFCPVNDMICFLDFAGSIFAFADEIVVTSKTTKKAVEEFTTDILISITPLGGNYVNQKNDNVHVREDIKKAADSGKYLIMVGTIDPRKNHKLLLDAYDMGLKDLPINLIIAGYKGWDVDELFDRMYHHPQFGNGLFHIVGATDEEINYLYQHDNCFSLAFASYAEGYGLPIIESLVRGVPVIAADTPINMEIGGDYALCFKQDNPQDLVEKVAMILKDSERYQAWRERVSEYQPPNWEDTTEGLYQVFIRE